MNTADVIEFLKRRVSLLDGVVVTGGEPTLQPGLITFMESVKSLGYDIKLDTNGSSPKTVREAVRRNACDYVAVDYKAPAEPVQRDLQGRRPMPERFWRPSMFCYTAPAHLKSGRRCCPISRKTNF